MNANNAPNPADFSVVEEGARGDGCCIAAEVVGDCDGHGDGVTFTGGISVGAGVGVDVTFAVLFTASSAAITGMN